MGFYVHSTNSIKMGMWGGIGTILTMNNSVLTCQSTLTTTTTNNNVLVSYFLPTPYSNGSTPVNQVSTDIVNLFNLLKSSSAVEWAEVFTIQGVVG